MEPFNLETFVKQPTLRVVNLLKKPQLIESQFEEGEIKRLLIDDLLDKKVIAEDEVDATSIQGTDDNTLKLWRLELQNKS